MCVFKFHFWEENVYFRMNDQEGYFTNYFYSRDYDGSRSWGKWLQAQSVFDERLTYEENYFISLQLQTGHDLQFWIQNYYQLRWWQILLIVLGSVFVFGLFVFWIYRKCGKCCRKKKQSPYNRLPEEHLINETAVPLGQPFHPSSIAPGYSQYPVNNPYYPNPEHRASI